MESAFDVSRPSPMASPFTMMQGLLPLLLLGVSARCFLHRQRCPLPALARSLGFVLAPAGTADGPTFKPTREDAFVWGCVLLNKLLLVLYWGLDLWGLLPGLPVVGFLVMCVPLLFPVVLPPL